MLDVDGCKFQVNAKNTPSRGPAVRQSNITWYVCKTCTHVDAFWSLSYVDT